MSPLFNTTDNSKRTKCENWTRAMGYYRPTMNFNPGKKSEFADRKFFTEANATANGAPVQTAVAGANLLAA